MGGSTSCFRADLLCVGRQQQQTTPGCWHTQRFAFSMNTMSCFREQRNGMLFELQQHGEPFSNDKYFIMSSNSSRVLF